MWGRGIKFIQMKGEHPSPRGDNSKRVKMHRGKCTEIFKRKFSRISKPILMKLGTIHSLVNLLI
jgi:hypothetical protein